MLVECHQLVTNLLYHLHLLQQHLIQVCDVFLHIGARLVYLIQQNHLLLHQVNHIINVPSVTID